MAEPTKDARKMFEEAFFQEVTNMLDMIISSRSWTLATPGSSTSNKLLPRLPRTSGRSVAQKRKKGKTNHDMHERKY